MNNRQEKASSLFSVGSHTRPLLQFRCAGPEGRKDAARWADL